MQASDADKISKQKKAEGRDFMIKVDGKGGRLRLPCQRERLPLSSLRETAGLLPLLPLRP